MFPNEITIFVGKSSHSQWLRQIIPWDTNNGLKKKPTESHWIQSNSKKKRY